MLPPAVLGGALGAIVLHVAPLPPAAASALRDGLIAVLRTLVAFAFAALALGFGAPRGGARALTRGALADCVRAIWHEGAPMVVYGQARALTPFFHAIDCSACPVPLFAQLLFAVPGVRQMVVSE